MKDYASSEIRLSPNSKIVCLYCLGQKATIEPKQEAKKPVVNEEMLEYTCGACKYSFKRKKSFVLTSCPYCGKNDSLSQKKSGDASNILKDSMSRQYDF
ncbi:MAG: hypothetical protein HGA85_07135 [Nanoarchaeota archaeon]|nr:hypothetical protein [Nanoarchaeota archaeon]